jgi:hypothetical protein
MNTNQTNYYKAEKSAQDSNLVDHERHVYRKIIAEAAYFKAESRGFIPGHELDDWLEAEIEYGVCGSGDARFGLQSLHPIHLAHPATSIPILTLGKT